LLIYLNVRVARAEAADQSTPAALVDLVDASAPATGQPVQARSKNRKKKRKKEKKEKEREKKKEKEHNQKTENRENTAEMSRRRV
jgi:hypothetical protein